MTLTDDEFALELSIGDFKAPGEAQGPPPAPLAAPVDDFAAELAGPPGTGDRIEMALGRFAGGVLELPAGTAEAFGIFREALIDQIDPYNATGVSDMPEVAIVAGGIRSLARDLLPPNADEMAEDFWSSTVPTALGSGAAFLGGGVAGKLAKLPGYLTTGTLGATVGAASTHRAVMDAGGTEEEAWEGYLAGALVGTSEVVPLSRMLSRLDKASGGGVKRLLVDAAVEGLEESVQEAFQAKATHEIVQHLTGEDLEYMQDLVEGAEAGFVSGALLSFAVSALGARGGARAAGVELDRGQTLVEAAPEDPALEEDVPAPAPAPPGPEAADVEGAGEGEGSDATEEPPSRQAGEVGGAENLQETSQDVPAVVPTETALFGEQETEPAAPAAPPPGQETQPDLIEGLDDLPGQTVLPSIQEDLEQREAEGEAALGGLTEAQAAENRRVVDAEFVTGTTYEDAHGAPSEGNPEGVALQGFTFAIRGPFDPERSPRPKGGRKDRAPHHAIAKTSPEGWALRILEHLRGDNLPRTLHAIGVEMIDKGADVTIGSNFARGLFLLTERKVVGHNLEAPIYFVFNEADAQAADALQAELKADPPKPKQKKRADWQNPRDKWPSGSTTGPETVLDFVVALGGIEARGAEVEDLKNELGDFAERLSVKGLGKRIPGLLKPRASKSKVTGLRPDDMATALREQGFKIEGPSQLLELIEDEIMGTPTYSPEAAEVRGEALQADHDARREAFESEVGDGSDMPAMFSPAQTHIPRGATATKTAEEGDVLEERGPDYNPLEAKQGAFARTKKDTPKAIRKSLREARERARTAGFETAHADNFYRIIDDLARRFNVGAPLQGKSKVLKRYALGFYRPDTGGIRTRRANAVRTFAHELGHHIHQVMYPGRRRPKKPGQVGGGYDFPREWKPSLIVLGRDLYGDKKPVGGYASEGWAEFVSYLVGNPAHLKKRVPKLYRAAVKKLVAENPEMWVAIQDARQRLANSVRVSHASPSAQLIDRRRSRTVPFATTYDRFRRLWFDRFQRVLRAEDDITGGKLPEHLSPYVAARRANGHISDDVRRAMELGTWDPADASKSRTGPALREILEPVRADIEKWEEYMVDRRVLEKRAQGFDALGADAEDAALYRTNDADLLRAIEATEEVHPEWGNYAASLEGREEGTVAARFRAFNQWLIEDYAVGMGLLSQSQAQRVTDLNQQYITFSSARTPDALLDGPGTAGRKGERFSGVGSGVKRFRGDADAKQIAPPIEAFIGTMQSIMSNARHNDVARKLFGLGGKGSGLWFDKTDRPIEAMPVKASDFGDEVLKQLGIGIDSNGKVTLPRYLEGLSEEDLDELVLTFANLRDATFFRQGNKSDEAALQVKVIENGKPVFYQLRDRELFEVLQGVGQVHIPDGVAKLFSLPGRALRAGATSKNPTFGLGNFARDTFQAMVLTEVEWGKLSETERVRLQAMREAFTGGKWEDLFLASGADMSGIFGEYFDPRTKRIDVDSLFDDRVQLAGLLRGSTPKTIAKDLAKLGSFERFNGALERSTRMGEFAAVYSKRIQEGASEAEAMAAGGMAAAEVTLDFQMGGVIAKNINQYVPFFNAAMLGGDKLVRFIKQNPRRALGRIATVVLAPSIATVLANGDDDDYWSQPQRIRDRYWLIPAGTHDDGHTWFIQIPKPYGLASFSIFLERHLAAVFGRDPATGELTGDPQATEFWDTSTAIFNEWRPGFSLPVILPMLEVAANYSMYRQGSITSQSEQSLDAELQGKGRSSLFGQAMAEFLSDDVGWTWSPQEVDYMVQGLFGGLGRDISSMAVDPMIATLTDRSLSETRAIRMENWPIVRRFVTGAPRASHQAIGRFYDNSTEYEKKTRSIKLLEEGSPQRAAYYHRNRLALELYSGRDENGNKIAGVYGDHYAKVRADISKHFAALRTLHRDPPPNPEEFDAQLTSLYGQIVDRARDAMRLDHELRTP